MHNKSINQSTKLCLWFGSLFVCCLHLWILPNFLASVCLGKGIKSIAEIGTVVEQILLPHSWWSAGLRIGSELWGRDARCSSDSNISVFGRGEGCSLSRKVFTQTCLEIEIKTTSLSVQCLTQDCQIQGSPESYFNKFYSLIIMKHFNEMQKVIISVSII
jgi:hypothetical protein